MRGAYPVLGVTPGSDKKSSLRNKTSLVSKCMSDKISCKRAYLVVDVAIYEVVGCGWEGILEVQPAFEAAPSPC